MEDFFENFDLSERGTQIGLAAAAIGGGLLIAFFRGNDKETATGEKPLIPVPGGWASRSDVPGAFGWVGSFGRGDIQNPPDKEKPESPQQPDPETPGPGTDPGPDVDDIVDGIADEIEEEIAKKPYGCPAGYHLAKESNGSGNDVCRHNSTGREIQVSYKEPPEHRYPNPLASGEDTTDSTEWVTRGDLTCPTGYGLAKESTGSGNIVCRHKTSGREIRAVQKGAGGDGPSNLSVPGLGNVGGFNPSGVVIRLSDFHRVQPGETLRSIAVREFGSDAFLARLARLNPDVVASGQLRAGDMLKLR